MLDAMFVRNVFAQLTRIRICPHISHSRQSKPNYPPLTSKECRNLLPGYCMLWANHAIGLIGMIFPAKDAFGTECNQRQPCLSYVVPLIFALFIWFSFSSFFLFKSIRFLSPCLHPLSRCWLRYVFFQLFSYTAVIPVYIHVKKVPMHDHTQKRRK